MNEQETLSFFLKEDLPYTLFLYYIQHISLQIMTCTSKIFDSVYVLINYCVKVYNLRKILMLICSAIYVPCLRALSVRSTCIELLRIAIFRFHSRLNGPFCVMLLLHEVNTESERSLTFNSFLLLSPTCLFLPSKSVFDRQSI